MEADARTGKIDLTPIQKFYSNTSILITGCTGFLGMLLLEKLLRSCPDITAIYLLVRKKKGKATNSRIEEMLDAVVFKQLLKEQPDVFRKVSPIEGDCALPDLGLSATDMAKLTREVNIVFHVAATVRFNEKLNTAVAINIRAIRDLIRLARQMPHLKSFLHVSTAYSNCVRDVIEEKIYPAPIDYNKLIYMAESAPEKLLEKITPKLVEPNPNTYTYTKQIAEDVLKQEAKQMPVAIYRPAVVAATYREPVDGWCGNLYGPTGIVLAGGIGLLRNAYVDGDNVANLIPADMCVNAMIATAWDATQNYEQAKAGNRKYEIPVYHYESSNDKPLKWSRFSQLTCEAGQKIPTMKTMWYYSFRLHKSYAVYLMSFLCFHLIPAAIVDTALFVTFNKPRLVKIYFKIHKLSKMMSYFCIKHIQFKSENTRKLLDRMSEKDKDIFFSDLKEIDWDVAVTRYAYGIRRYITKDPDDNLPEALKRYNRLYWLHIFTKLVTSCLFLLTAWYITCWVFKRAA